jgi:predicted DNA-binding protein (UPF0251 family)
MSENTQRVIGYTVGESSHPGHDPMQKSIKKYAEARAWTLPIIHDEASVSHLSRLSDRVTAAGMLNTLGKGDTLVLPTLSLVVSRPSDLLALLEVCMARGVNVHCTDLGDLSAYLPVLRAICSCFTALETQFDENEREVALERQEWVGTRAQIIENCVAEIVGKLGGAAVMAKLPPIEMEHKTSDAEISFANDARRRVERLGIKQVELAKEIGVSQSAISRFLEKGRLSKANEVLDRLYIGESEAMMKGEGADAA